MGIAALDPSYTSNTPQPAAGWWEGFEPDEQSRKNNQTRTPFVLLLLILSGLCLGATAHAESLDTYAHRAQIKAEGAGPYFHFPLTLEVYQSSLSPGLRDLRVFNAAGELVPHALTLKTDIPQPKVVQTKLKGFPLYSDETTENGGFRIRREKNGALVSVEPAKATVTRKLTGVILDASRIDAPLVALDISLDDYRQPFQHFRIEASDDLKQWQGVQDSATIAVLEQEGSRIEQRQVELPSIRAKYLRLTWLDPQEIPSLPVVTATSSSTPQQSQPEILWTEAIAPVRNTKGEYLYRLDGMLPVERIRFFLPQLNTLAPAQLLVRSSDKQPWRRVSSTVLYRLAAQGGESLSPDIDLGGETITELQLKLDTRAGGVGDKPLQLKVAINPQQLVFLARGDSPFTLAWGLANDKTSALPLTTLVPAYRYQNGLPGNAASLGTDEKNPAPIRAKNDAATEPIDPALMHKWILWGVLIAGAVLLLLMAMKLMRSGGNANS
jgi:hypothetical protein